jgi:hypothetical protein
MTSRRSTRSTFRGGEPEPGTTSGPEFSTNGWVPAPGALAALTGKHHYADALRTLGRRRGLGAAGRGDSHQARLPQRRLTTSWPTDPGPRCVSPRAICRCSGRPQRLEGAQHHSVALIDRRQRFPHSHSPGFRSNAPALIISAIRGGVSLADSPSGSTISASTISSGSTS